MYADVLVNPRPPFYLRGGVRVALEQSRGATYAVSRAQALAAKATFEALEGVSINEPSACACACAGLEVAIASKRIGADDAVLLNITGGGEELIRRDFDIKDIRIDCYSNGDVDDPGLLRALADACSPGARL